MNSLFNPLLIEGFCKSVLSSECKGRLGRKNASHENSEEAYIVIIQEQWPG